MDNTAARQRILQRIGQALANPVVEPYPHSAPDNRLHAPHDPDILTDIFKKEFTSLLGNFFLFDSIAAMNEKLHSLAATNNWKNICYEENIAGLFGHAINTHPDRAELLTVEVAITGCLGLVAQTGTVVLSSSSAAGRALPVYAPVHIAVAYKHQLYFDLDASLQGIMTEGADALPSSLVYASGPSRTGDIEKTLVVGVHGPRETYVFMLP